MAIEATAALTASVSRDNHRATLDAHVVEQLAATCHWIGRARDAAVGQQPRAAMHLHQAETAHRSALRVLRETPQSVDRALELLKRAQADARVATALANLHGTLPPTVPSPDSWRPAMLG